MPEDTGMIHGKLADLLADVPDIGKDSKNVQQGFMFRGIDQCYNVLHPLFAKHRIVVVPEVLDYTQSERTTKTGGTLIYIIVKMAFDFYAEDGSCVRAVTIGQAMDSGDKAGNKAMAVALKYALFQTFLIPTEETTDDPDAQSHTLAGKSPKKSPGKNPKPADKPAGKPSEPGDAPVCPECGAIMELRTVQKSGKNQGKKFFGCPEKDSSGEWCKGFLWLTDWQTRKARLAKEAGEKDDDPANDDHADEPYGGDVPF